jgi:3-phosphoshikimate 1-carboxyvinyltransferase
LADTKSGAADVRHLEPATRPVDATLEIPGSKSVTNRALLLAALARGTSSLSGLLASDDTEAMLGALRALGFDLRVDWRRRSAVVVGGGGAIPAREAEVECGEAGTVARFLLAVCAAGRGRYAFDGRPSLRRRPLGPLTEALGRMGAAFEPQDADRLPLTLRADGLRGGRCEVQGGSSQFLSGLLMAAPLCDASVELVWADPLSRPYLDMTCAMMRDFGVSVARPDDARFLVEAPRSYRAAEVVVEADASTASYFFAAAAVTGGRVTVRNLSRRSCRQGDIRFLDILEAMGCGVEDDGRGTTVVGPPALRAIRIDMADTPDVFMTLACLAPYADGPVEISGVAQTRAHESDRIAVAAANLQRLGVTVVERWDGLRIEPGPPRAGAIDSHGDHRVAMSFAVLSLGAPGIDVRGADCVAKTCPEFFDLWRGMLQRTG